MKRFPKITSTFKDGLYKIYHPESKTSFIAESVGCMDYNAVVAMVYLDDEYLNYLGMYDSSSGLSNIVEITPVETPPSIMNLRLYVSEIFDGTKQTIYVNMNDLKKELLNIVRCGVSGSEILNDKMSYKIKKYNVFMTAHIELFPYNPILREWQPFATGSGAMSEESIVTFETNSKNIRLIDHEIVDETTCDCRIA